MTRQRTRSLHSCLIAAFAMAVVLGHSAAANAYSSLGIADDFAVGASQTALSIDLTALGTDSDDVLVTRGSWAGSDVVFVKMESSFYPGDISSFCTHTGWPTGWPDYYCEVSGDLTLSVLTNDGDDKIEIGTLHDSTVSVQSGDGEDTITTENFEGKATLNGQADRDILHGGSGDSYLLGGFGDDVITGGSGSEKIFGASGIDTIDGREGNDSIYGGADDDSVNGGAGDDTLYGDFLTGDSPGNDTIIGGTGIDTVIYSDRTAAITVKNNNSPESGEADETDKISDSVEKATTGPGDDNITMTGEDPNSVSSGAGNDTVNVENGFGDRPGANTVDCGDGDTDTVTANWALDTSTVTNCELGMPTTETVTEQTTAATTAAVETVFSSAVETTSLDNPQLSWSGKKSIKLMPKRRPTVAKLSPVVYLKASEALTSKVRIRAVVGGKKLTLYSKTKLLSANKKTTISVKKILGAKKLSKKVKRIRAAVLKGLKRRGKKVKFIFTATGTASDGRKAVSATSGSTSATRTVTVTRKRR